MKNKKNQILDVSYSLFLEKGFDKTSINDILNHLDIARGTLYYHFESKEAIMDAIIERAGQQVMSELKKISASDELSVYEKLFSFFAGMNMQKLSGADQIIDYLNQPQNALFHEKSNQMMIEKISPLLARILTEGIREKLFETRFPNETAEIILVAVIGFLDSHVREEDFEHRLAALVYNVERMLGVEEGDLKQFQDWISYQQRGESNDTKL